MELWKVIAEIPTYSVSNQGRIRNNNTDKIKSLSPDKKGYIRVRIGGKTRKVHRLVAQAFVPNADCKPEVNHIDGNKSNNDANNLEWVSHSENQLHACHVLGKVRGKDHMNKMAKASGKKTSKRVICVETGVIYSGLREAGRLTGISRENIGSVLHNRQKTAGGFKWKYVEVSE